MEDSIKLELTIVEINTLLAGLAELPFKQVADLFNKIHLQSNAHLAAKAQEDNGVTIETVDLDDKPGK